MTVFLILYLLVALAFATLLFRQAEMHTPDATSFALGLVIVFACGLFWPVVLVVLAVGLLRARAGQ